MSRREKKALWRLLLATGLLVFALACGQQSCSCDCAAPLDRPLDENTRLYDSMQARLTPAAFDFIEQNLPDIIETFMEGGLTFDVPPTDASQEIGWCPVCITIDITICQNHCPLTAEIVDVNLTPVSPNKLQLDAHINLRGTITINGTFDCDIPLDIRNKPVRADVYFLTDDRDRLLYFDVGQVTLTISSGDIQLTCDWGWLSDIGLGSLIDDVVNWLVGLLTPLLNNQLNSQLNQAVDDAVADSICLPCDYYTLGCPSPSSCQNNFCQQAGGCRKTPMGMVGAVDLSEQMSGLGHPNPLKVMLMLGQWSATSVDRVVVNNGLELRLIGAADAERHPCVPEPSPSEIPANAPPARLVFTDTVPGTSDGYMAGVGVSDAMLDWFLYKLHLGGLLCLSLGTETTDMLTSSTLALMGMPSLNALTGHRPAPVMIKFRPTRVPYAEIGAGTFTTDAQGNRVIDEPLLYIFIPGLELDFWVKIDERWIKVVTIGLDLEMDLGLDVDAQNRLVPFFGDDSIKLSKVRVTNYELLEEDPAGLEQLLPALIGMALPMLTGAIKPIEIPPLQGFVVEIRALKGVKPRAGTPYYEYIGLYASLRFEP